MRGWSHRVTSAGGFEWHLASLQEVAAVVLLTAIFLGSVFAARRRLGNTVRWATVAVLNAVACLALAALIAPPVLLRPATDAVVLVTDGATALPDAVAKTFVAPGGGNVGRGPTYLLDLGQLPLKEPALGVLSVMGHGLSEDEWQALPPDLDVRYDAPSLTGLIAAGWQRSLPEGDALTVSGRYRDDPSASARRIELIDPAGVVVASHDLLTGDDFRLVTRPKAPGLLTYRLRVSTDERELSSEPLPVHVRSGERPLLYVLQSAPSFETRQLSNWAGDNGAAVIIETTITRGRTLSQRINAESISDDRLSPVLLAKTGLAVVDGRAWVGLDKSRRAWFETAVRGGMGLLVLADTTLARQLDGGGDSLIQGFRLTPRDRDEDGYAVTLDGTVSDVDLPLAGLALEVADGGALTGTAGGEVIEAYRNVGLGRVAVSVLRERHRWLTSGDESNYTAYWARMMREIGRPVPLPQLLPAANDAWPGVGQRLTLCALAGSETVAISVSPFAADSPLDLETSTASTGGPRRCAMFWPWQAGWHRVSLYADGATEAADLGYYYVFADDEWQAQTRFARQQATLARSTRAGDDTATRTARVAVEPLWPWLVLVLSAGLLWLERRLHG